jgi:hypothetical protein
MRRLTAEGVQAYASGLAGPRRLMQMRREGDGLPRTDADASDGCETMSQDVAYTEHVGSRHLRDQRSGRGHSGTAANDANHQRERDRRQRDHGGVCIVSGEPHRDGEPHEYVEEEWWDSASECKYGCMD